MPTSPLKNLLYRAALPFSAPSPHKLMRHESFGHELNHLPYYEHLMVHHHVLGASSLLDDGNRRAELFTSVTVPMHIAKRETFFRVASITKMATSLLTLRCIAEGLFSLDTPIQQLLPTSAHGNVLSGVTIRHLLSHTSGLCDVPEMDAALRDGRSYDDVLSVPRIRIAAPGERMEYSNFGFGLLGCILENVTGEALNRLFEDRLFNPLGMRATIDASSLDEEKIMPISRVLPYRKGEDVTITRLGRKPMSGPDPLHHFGHTAGAMYTDAESLTRLLKLIGSSGMNGDERFLPEDLVREMTSVQASTTTRTYGLGLVILNRSELSPRRLLGHQGFAYGCVDGAFIEEETGRMVIFLNGGASEARQGKLGLVNRDVLKWALTKEMPSWM